MVQELAGNEATEVDHRGREEWENLVNNFRPSPKSDEKPTDVFEVLV
jgi:hypothetical protein